MQPLDEAEYQCGPAGIRMAGSALDYWRETLRGSSRTAKPRAPLAAEGTHQTITTLWSPSMYQAVLKIVSTTGFGSHSALLAAVATALAMVRERERVDLLTQVHNRFDPRLRDAITSLTQQALFSIDCPSSKALLEDDRSVTRAAFAAYQYGYYDKTMVAPVVAEVSAAHPDVDLTYWVNDKTDAIERASDAVIPTVEGCEPSTLSTEVCAYKVPDTTCGVRILSGESSLGLEVLADSARFGVDRAEAVAREIERVLLDRARSLPER
jgi:hypothetical protein